MPDAARFLDAAGWGGATAVPLAGDASSRRYARLRRADGQSAILMQAPPLPDDSTRRFVTVTRHLEGWGLSAPRLLAEDADNGLLLLEDLGDAVFARVIADNPTQEPALYAAAVDLLAALHRHAAPAGLPCPDAQALAGMTDLAALWYLGQSRPAPDCAADARAARDLQDHLAPLLEAHANPALPVLVHRDFHAENLIWLPDRIGAARTGLLDFQDAWSGHPAYDLVSLLDDARRDLGPGIRSAAIARYLDATGQPDATFRAALATSGAQRNLRILGVFARLSLHFGKPRYVDLIPRVWGHLQGNLAHPALDGLRDWVTHTLPAPTPALLQGLKDRCGTIPAP